MIRSPRGLDLERKGEKFFATLPLLSSKFRGNIAIHRSSNLSWKALQVSRIQKRTNYLRTGYK